MEDCLILGEGSLLWIRVFWAGISQEDELICGEEDGGDITWVEVLPRICADYQSDNAKIAVITLRD